MNDKELKEVSSVLYITEASLSKEKTDEDVLVKDPSPKEIEEFFKSDSK